jgi:hypothetical protein
MLRLLCLQQVPIAKKTIAKKTMVWHFISSSREISFRIDDRPSRNSG